MQQSLWRVEAGVLTAEVSKFRLVVTKVSDEIRFEVMRRDVSATPIGPNLLGSGILTDARSAMLAAERMAADLAAIDQPRRNVRLVT